eukprot:scaffold37627_cov16-Tisochrysis_lutea.AAC.1
MGPAAFGECFTDHFTQLLACSENIGLDISERDTFDNPDGIKYELSGESCIPGIDASALESIFEEHAVSPALDPAGTVPFQLGLRERAFNFGAVIADLTTAPGEDILAQQQEQVRCRPLSADQL